MVVTAVIHNPPNIEVEHDGAANGEQTSLRTIYNELDDTLTEENVPASQHKMVLKKIMEVKKSSRSREQTKYQWRRSSSSSSTQKFLTRCGTSPITDQSQISF